MQEENNTNAKIMGVLVLAGAIVGAYFLLKGDSEKTESLNGFEVLLFKKTKLRDLKKGRLVAYPYQGDFKVGRIDFVKKGLVNVGGSVYTADELKLVKKS